MSIQSSSYSLGGQDHFQGMLSEQLLEGLPFQEEIGCENDQIIDYSVPGNRLIRHLDGSLELIPKSPAYVLGEKVIRPALDASMQIGHHAYHILKRGLSSLDNVISRLFNFIPRAQASEVVKPSEKDVDFEAEHKELLKQALSIFSNSLANALKQLPPEQRLALQGDRIILDGTSRVKNTNWDLILTLFKEKLDWKEFKRKIRNVHLTTLVLKDNLSSILKDLQEKGAQSRYSPLKSDTITLRFPKYSDDFQQVLLVGHVFHNSEKLPLDNWILDYIFGRASLKSSIISKKESEKELIMAEDEKNVEDIMEKLFFENFTFDLGLLGLHVEGTLPLSSEQIRKAFSEENVKNYEESVTKFKANLKSGRESGREYINLEMKSLQSKSKNEIFKISHDIHEEHVKIINAQNNGLKIEPISMDENGLSIAWKVMHPRIHAGITEHWAYGEGFKFCIDDCNLKDEL